jgi:hypothetical protein
MEPPPISAIPMLIRDLRESPEEIPSGRLQLQELRRRLQEPSALPSEPLLSKLQALGYLEQLRTAGAFPVLLEAYDKAYQRLIPSPPPKAKESHWTGFFLDTSGGLDQISKTARPLKKGWTGSYCRIQNEEVHRIVSKSDWAALWRRAFGHTDNLPELDFDKEMAIAVFSGSSSAFLQRVDGMDEDQKQATVIYRYGFFDTLSKPRTSFLIMVAPRVRKKLIVKARWYQAMGREGTRERVVKTFDPD